jgi:hypothetical protein
MGGHGLIVVEIALSLYRRLLDEVSSPVIRASLPAEDGRRRQPPAGPALRM